jgi:hypothetical protein
MFKRIFIITMLITLFTGCMTVKFGSMPDTQVLSTQLTQHLSNKADVLRVIGSPRGYGMVSYPPMPHPYVTWFYEFTESDGVNVDLKMLLVFFDGETYSGHLWFSSFEKLEVIK